jgi:subfamily B ATP-binding cassette protein MsbA
MVGFALTSGISIGMISPFVKILFTPRHAAEAPAALPAPIAAVTGLDATAPPAVSEAAPDEAAKSGIPARASAWKKDLRTWFEHFFLTGNPITSLTRICLTLLIVFFLKNVFDYLQSVLTVSVEQAVVRDLRNEVYGHLHELSLSFFHSRRTGALLSRLTNDIALVRGALAAGFSNFVKSILLLTVCLFWIFWTSWRLALVSCLVVPPSVFLIVWLGKKLRRRSTITQERMADLNSILQETLTGIRVVKAFSMEEFEKQKFARVAQAYFRSFVKQRRLGALAGPLSETLGVFAATLVLWYGGHEILLQRSMEPQQFFIFLFAMLQLMSPLKSLSNVNATIQEGLAAAVRIFRLLDTKPTVVSRPGARIAQGIQEGIDFDHVSFRYGGGPHVLSDVTFEVRAGEVVALVGPSGAGKSTLADLVARFYDPTEGSIRLDGKDLRDYDLASHRRMMGVVTQESILFNDTVWNNIAYGVTDADEEAVRRAARAANAERFILDMAEGYQTTIGDRGVLLSGGERQRIAIARAIFKNPSLLLWTKPRRASTRSRSSSCRRRSMRSLRAGRPS